MAERHGLWTTFRAVVAALWLAGLYMAFIGTPDERTLGPSDRILFIHLGAAWTVAIAYSLAALLSLLYLLRPQPRYDRWAAASVEVGTVLTTAVLVSGSIWAKFAWGTYWTWDPRLTTTAVLWFLYLGYLMMRSSIDRPDQRAKVSAIWALVAFLDVPIVFEAVTWWRSIHPEVITTQGFAMPGSMVVAVFVFFAAVVGLFIELVRLRVRQAEIESGIAVRKAQWMGQHT